MKKRYLFMFAAILASGLLFGGCDLITEFLNGGGGGDGGAEEPSFVAVSGITNVPDQGPVRGLALNGTVVPENATSKAITWSIKSPGATNATISGNILSATGVGTLTVTATVVGGVAGGDYIEDFEINILQPPPSLTVTVQGINYTLKLVPGGTVTSNPWGSGTRYPLPQTIPTFRMGETEITYELWYAVRTWAESNGYTFVNMGKEGSSGTAGAEPTSAKLHPVAGISWRDIVVWCNAYSEAAGKTPVYYLEGTTNFNDSTKVLRESEADTVSSGTGKAEKAVVNPNASGFRLPTEAEWEYAARGGNPSTTTPWTYTYAGSNTIDDVAVYYGTNSAAVVKSKAANTLGLYDMTGNMYEWCWDAVDDSQYVLRGGRYGYLAQSCEISISNKQTAVSESSSEGFRVVCRN